MPQNTRLQKFRRRTAPGRWLGTLFITVGLVAAAACTPSPEPQAEAVSNPVKLLQSVHVGLSPAAGVQSVEGTTISVSAEGASSAADTTYDAEEAVDGLPVRVSLQYRAGEKSGSDLADLQGHTGPVEIDLTVENLTVKPQVVEYDAAGQTHANTAFVGAPLTIAASTKLNGVRVDDITPGSADGAQGTNGVLSRSEDGAAVVQWATVLAPPRSGASTTLRLAADVRDFQVPDIDVAVQPGISTDMSVDGVLAAAFSSDAGSEMELQTRTISLVSEVNTVLIKAGATITEVRQNLDTTSQTLGAKTAGELRDSSEALAATMSGLKDQLTALGANLETAAKGTQSVTLSQLQQTVSAVDSMLGDTSAPPPVTPVDGVGCAAEVAKPRPGSTVYSSILTMASQLDAYATVNADCRDTVAEAIEATMGPLDPTPEECAEQGSMTCSLYGSAVTVTAALVGLVKKGEALTNELEPKIVEGALANQRSSAETLKQASTQLAAILEKPDSPEDYKSALTGVLQAIEAAEESGQASADATRDASAAARSSIDGLRDRLSAVGLSAETARTELHGGPLWDRSMTAQSEELAAELCALADGEAPRDGRLSTRDAERLRSYLTSVPCGQPGETAPIEALTPPLGFRDPLDVRLDGQSTAWDEVLSHVDTTGADQAISQAFTALDQSIDGIATNLDAVSDAVAAMDTAATGGAAGTRRGLVALQVTLEDAIAGSAEVHTNLENVKSQQEKLQEGVKNALTEVSAETAEEIYRAVDEQVRQVNEIGTAGSESVTSAFNRSIAGLKSTSDQVVNDAGETVDRQRGQLQEEGSALAEALSASTQSSLERIASSTSNSTRDMEGADALLSSSLNKVMLDLGDRTVNGSGLLGSMATSAAKADTADYQLALAAQNAEGYANIRSRDVAALLLRQAQFKASLTAVDEMPAFHLTVPDGAVSQTLYTFKIGGAA